VWKYSTALAVISAFVVILTAGYILWALQRVYLGAEYKGPHPEALRDITPRELAIAVPLLAFAIYFGVNPNALLKYMQPSIDQTVVELADWTKANEPAKLQKQEAPATAGRGRQPVREGLTTEYTEGTERITNDEFQISNVGGNRHLTFGNLTFANVSSVVKLSER
jgi:hypothetical protein